MPAYCAKDPLPDFLRGELEKKLASLPDDNARLVMLAQQFGAWSLKARRFHAYGEQPFGEPHPEYGAMTAGDFIIVLGMIDGARARIERRAA